MPTRKRRVRGRLKRGDFALPADELAQALLGCLLVRMLDDGTRLAGRIVEVEAYLAPADRASHAYKRRRTERTEPMFAAPGTSYVYFTYGMHFCMNVSAAAVDVPEAVLLRALEPVEGLDAMRELRTAGSRAKRARKLADTDLCSGPAKLCQAMAIDRALSGMDTTQSDQLWFEAGPPLDASEIAVGPRIGIASAGEWVHAPLRWWQRDSLHVSVRGGEAVNIPERRTDARQTDPNSGGS